MTCSYSFVGINGEPVMLNGKSELKAYLLSPGGMAHLLPSRADVMPAFRRTPIQSAVSADMKERIAMVERLAGGINDRMKNPPKLVVFTDMQDPRIPERVRAQDKAQRDGGAKGEVGGVFTAGTVYLNATQLKTPQQAAIAYAHEALGHYGLRGLFGTELNAVLEQVIALRKADVAAKVKEYGRDVKNEAHLLEAAEEVLAEMAQTKPNSGFVKRAVAAIRTWLRKNVTGFSSMQFSDAEIIRDFILPARAFVEQGAAAGKAMADGATDVRFLRTTDAAPVIDTSLTPPEQGLLLNLQSNFQDNNNVINGIQKRIEKLTGAKIPEYADYYGAETNRPGRIAARLEDFRNHLRGPLIARIAKSGHTMKQAEELAHAMHAAERNEVVAKINPKFDPSSKKFEGMEGSGMSTENAKEILAKYADDVSLHKHVEDMRAIALAGLDMKRAAGLLTDDQYSAYRTAYKFYVPLKGDGEYGPQAKRAMGHDSREEHILENVMRDYEQAVVATERNVARMPLLQLMLENPDKTLWEVGVAPKGRYVQGYSFRVMKNGEEVAVYSSSAQVHAFLEYFAGEGNYEVLDEKGERVKEFEKPLQDNEVVVYVDGQRVRMQIKNEDLANQLRPLNKDQMNVILAAFRDVLRCLSRIYTAYSPTFIFTNPIRDMHTGTVTMLGNQGGQIAAKAWLQYPAAMKALVVFASTGHEPKGKAGSMLKEYRMHGGKTGASHMSDLEQQGESLQRLFDDAYGATGYLAQGKLGKATVIAGRKMLYGMAHVIEVANQATENGLRLALYTALRNDGMSPGNAAQAAKNVTVNFDRKGSQTGVMSALYLFINPAVQGTANAFKAIANGDHKAQAWAALASLTMLGMYAAGQGMDDDKDRWLGENWGNRSKRLVFTIGGHRISIPLSMEFSPFYAVGVAMEEARREAASTGQTAGHIITSFIDAYVPFKGLFDYDSDNHALDAVTAMVPTVLRPGIEAATNRNVFGSNIVPESSFTKDRPDNLKMNRNTKGTVYDSAAQGIAGIGTAFGAGKYENDISKVSPEMLKHWWRTYTGGLGSFIGDMASLGKIAAEDAGSVELADVPVAKSFVAGQNVKPIRGRYYELTRDARAAATEFAEAKKAGDGDAMDDILNRPEKAELIGLGKLIQSTNKAVGAIRNEMVDINADTSMSVADKRAKLKELEKIEEEIYRGAISAFK